MNRKEALEQIKKLVFGEEVPTPAPAPAAPAVFGTEYKLADGNSIMIDKLEVGGIAKIGEEVAPDGVHALEDGTSFEIKEGIIVAVTPKEEEKPAEADMATQMATMQKEFENFKTEFETYKANFEKVSEKADNQLKANEELVKLVEFLAEEPVVQPVQAPVDFEKMTPLERFRFQKQQSN